MAFLKRPAAPPDLADFRVRLVLERDRTAGVTLGRLEPFDLVLVRSTPAGPVPVSGTELATLGLPTAKVVDAALRATWEQELVKLDVREQPFMPRRSIRVAAIDDSPYVTTALLLVQRWAGADPSVGAFVSAPAYSALAALPLASRTDAHLVSGMGEICRYMSATMADPCDPTVYWWDGKRLERIRFTAVAGSGTSLLAGPSRLRQILAGLPDTDPQST